MTPRVPEIVGESPERRQGPLTPSRRVINLQHTLETLSLGEISEVFIRSEYLGRRNLLLRTKDSYNIPTPDNIFLFPILDSVLHHKAN